MKQENTFFEKMGKIVNVAGNAIMMNLLFLVSCLPIVTIGQAWCALLSAIRYNIRGEKWFEGYKFGFKTRFWRGTLSWCVMLLLNVHMLLDVHYAFAEGLTAQLVISSLMFALTAMATTALLVLNVYIPTKVGTWINNVATMLFKAPLQLLGAAAAAWAPVVLALLWFEIFYYLALVFLAIYFTVAALAGTILLKDTLLDYLLQARADGSLLAEEGRQAEDYEDEEDEEE